MSNFENQLPTNHSPLNTNLSQINQTPNPTLTPNSVVRPKIKTKQILGLVVLGVVILGLGVAFILSQMNQNITPKASEYKSQNPRCNLRCNSDAACQDRKMICFKSGNGRGVCRLKTNPEDKLCGVGAGQCQKDEAGDPICPQLSELTCPSGQIATAQGNDACGCAKPPKCETAPNATNSVQLPWMTDPASGVSASYSQSGNQFTIEAKTSYAHPRIYQELNLGLFNSLGTTITQAQGIRPSEEVGLEISNSQAVFRLRTWATDQGQLDTIGFYRHVNGQSQEVAQIKAFFTAPLHLELVKTATNTLTAYYYDNNGEKKLIGSTSIPNGKYKAGMFLYGEPGGKATFNNTNLNTSSNESDQ